jgi:hypothetical protein
MCVRDVEPCGSPRAARNPAHEKHRFGVTDPMPPVTKDYSTDAAAKVPEVTLVFWIIKVAATTFGETGGDSVTMTLDWGYLTGTAIFLAILVALVVVQVIAKKFHPFLYWATIVASTTFGTTMADFADRSLESVRKDHTGLHSFRSMKRIEARRKNAKPLRLRFSQSLASRRQRLSQAMVRSTIQRLGSTAKPFT